MPHAPCPMPHALFPLGLWAPRKILGCHPRLRPCPCPMPYDPFPMPHAHDPLAILTSLVPAMKGGFCGWLRFFSSPFFRSSSGFSTENVLRTSLLRHLLKWKNGLRFIVLMEIMHHDTDVILTEIMHHDTDVVPSTFTEREKWIKIYSFYGNHAS